jgi:hypothetical protein
MKTKTKKQHQTIIDPKNKSQQIIYEPEKRRRRPFHSKADKQRKGQSEIKETSTFQSEV